MDYGLIGEKLGHSYSPQIHAQLADYRYELKPIPQDELDQFMRSKDFLGINVTIPYKKAVIPYCSRLTPEAKSIQAVNTIVKLPDGSLLGHNTDIAGFITMVEQAGITVNGKKAVVLGSGGTSLTACAALKMMGAAEIIVISRNGEINYTTLYEKHKDAQLLVNTTPVGMYPNTGVSPVDLQKLSCVDSVVDVIYNPEKTALILQAQALGLKFVSGLPMLVAQARKAAELFCGHEIPAEKDAEIIRSIKAQTLNLVLVGMPGCGKTTLGKLLSEKMNRPLIDTDEEIVKLAGKTIPEIFAQDGEAHFRDLEAQVMKNACALQGAVITTGGGAVIRRENRLSMTQNGRVCHILRPLNSLDRSGRPLSTDLERLQQLWHERKEMYAAAADYVIENTTTPEAAANAALEGFYETIGD